MSKSDSDYLFSLIKSLGKGEKRHFKVYSAKHVIGEENSYVKLFDLMDAQRTYDEAAVRKKIFANFPSLKTRLYNAILWSLEEFHSSPAMVVKSLMNHIEILFNKSLYPQCLKQILKAKQIAEKHELFEFALEILRWEFRVMMKKSDYPAVQKVLEEEKKFLGFLNNHKTYRDLAATLSYKYNQFGSERNPKKMKEMEKMVRHPSLDNRSNALSLRAKQNYHDSHSLYAIIRGDYKTIYRESKAMLDLYHANAHIIYMYASPYLGTLNSFLIAVQGLKKYEEMRKYLDNLNEVRKYLRTPSEKATAFFYMYHYLNYFILTGQFSEADKIVRELELELNEHSKGLNQHKKTMLCLSIAQIYFGHEQYRKCLQWLNKIILLGEMKERKDIECFVRIFFLLVHFEMGSGKDFMTSLYKSTYRFLNEHRHLLKFETEIMEFFWEVISKDIPKKNLKEKYMNLKAEFESLAKDPYEKYALDYFDFISWTESKIENKTFGQVIREKNSSG